MTPQRDTTIDFLRGFAMILIILIHVTVYFRHDPVAYWLWEYSQVAVPIFIFCSAYVYFKRTKKEHIDFSYFLQRTKRLVFPYYVFLFFLFLYTFFLKKTLIPFDAMAKKIFFLNVSSRDLDWLVVLFLCFTVIMPLVHKYSKRLLVFWTFIGVSALTSIVLLFTDIPLSFRYSMWLPWSLVLVISYFVVHYENKRWFFPSILFLLFNTYLFSRELLISLGSSLTLIDNKYPPNMYYLSYGTFIMLLMYVFYRRYGSISGRIQECFNFLSKYSYSIFFIHFLILYYFLDFTNYEKMEWWGLFGVVTVLTILIQIGVNSLKKFISFLR